MRHGRAAKQCVRMGPVGYFCGCQRRLTNPNPNSNRDCHCHGYGDCHRNSNSFAYTHSDGDAVHGKMFPDAQATSHTCAEAIRRDFRAIS
jgi:hypothetical protein